MDANESLSYSKCGRKIMLCWYRGVVAVRCTRSLMDCIAETSHSERKPNRRRTFDAGSCALQISITPAYAALYGGIDN